MESFRKIVAVALVVGSMGSPSVGFAAHAGEEADDVDREEEEMMAEPTILMF